MQIGVVPSDNECNAESNLAYVKPAVLDDKQHAVIILYRPRHYNYGSSLCNS